MMSSNMFLKLSSAFTCDRAEVAAHSSYPALLVRARVLAAHQEVEGGSVLLPCTLVALHVAPEVVGLDKSLATDCADKIPRVCVLLPHVFL